ncbi:MAG: hypothetical protein EBX36_03745 [Planctomycetia bacterium]|nr:hypothetical protein [Planctomycetia bacterium]
MQFHHPPFSAGIHGQAPGTGPGRDPHSGQPLRSLVPLLRAQGVRAVFSGHDAHYEHSIVDGVHYYCIGTGGRDLRPAHEGVVNERQIFLAHDHAPEHWNGDVLEQGGRHYGHIEIDVIRPASVEAAAPAAGTDAPGAGARVAAAGTNPAPAGFEVTITPVYVFPILDPARPGTIVSWERRTYDDTLTFTAGTLPAAPAADGPPPQPSSPEPLP